MRSRVDRARRAAEHVLRAVALIALAVLLWRAVRMPRPEAGDVARGALTPALVRWTVSPPGAMHVVFDTPPDVRSRDWLRALVRAGTPARWTGALTAAAVVAEPAVQPSGGMRVRFASASRNPVSIQDAAGLIDSLRMVARRPWSLRRFPAPFAPRAPRLRRQPAFVTRSHCAPCWFLGSRGGNRSSRLPRWKSGAGASRHDSASRRRSTSLKDRSGQSTRRVTRRSSRSTAPPRHRRPRSLVMHDKAAALCWREAPRDSPRFRRSRQVLSASASPESPARSPRPRRGPGWACFR